MVNDTHTRRRRSHNLFIQTGRPGTSVSYEKKDGENIRNVYWWPALRVRYSMLADVSPSSVRCLSGGLSHGRISKTKQDRPTVAMEHYIEVSSTSLILLPHSDPAPNASKGRYSDSDINTTSCSTMTSDHSCCHQSSTVVTPQVLSTVENNATVGTCC